MSSLSKKLWSLFFCAWAVIAVAWCWVAPGNDWWFPTGPAGTGEAMSPLGERIDDLFYMILIITTVVFIGTQIALGYVLFTGAARSDQAVDAGGKRSWFSHGRSPSVLPLRRFVSSRSIFVRILPCSR